MTAIALLEAQLNAYAKATNGRPAAFTVSPELFERLRAETGEPRAIYKGVDILVRKPQ